MQQMLMEKLVSEAQHYRNKEFLKAIMAVCALVALADDEFQVVERQRIFQAFSRVPALRELDFHKALEILEAYTYVLRRDGLAAKEVLYKKVRRMAGKHKRVRTMMRLAYLIIVADEEVHDAEMREFQHLCGLLNLQPDQVWHELSA
jgi:tellurite resistance protein TerB